MSDRRIRVPKDKSDVVKKLKFDATENINGVFDQYSDLLVFSALLGYSNNRFVPFEGSLIDPIRWDVFVRGGIDKIFYLLALVHDSKPENLSQSEEVENIRASIFESYANGGLEILQQQLHGKSDPLDHILLMIGNQRPRINEDSTLL